MTSRKERILFVAPIPPPVAGVAQVSMGLLSSLNQSEFSVEVIDLSKHKNVRVQTYSIGVHSYPFALRIWFRLILKLVSFRPGIVYLASSYDWSFLRNVALMGTAKLFGARVVCHFHGRREGGLFDLPSFVLESILHISSFTYDRIIFLSEGLKRSLSPSMGVQKSIVINNFVDPENFTPSEAVASEVLRIIFIGRLSDDKGIFELIDAVALLCGHGTLFAVDALGIAETEADEKKVREYALQRGVSHQLIFHGPVIGTEKARLLSSASLLVLPSKLEIFPIVILEAFAIGLPVVATRVGAVPEVVADGINGILVNAGDAHDLARGIQRLANDRKLREAMSKVNRMLAETTYSRHVAAERFLALLRSL